MVNNHHFTRIDMLELKDVIYGKIGRQRAEKYFDQIKRFICLKLTKPEFDKSCIRIIGKDNISLHNSLIRSILRNSCLAKIPPQKSSKVEGVVGIKGVNDYQRNCFQSPQKGRYPPVYRDRKFRDRPSPLGPLGKSPSLTYEETASRIPEQSGAELHSICSKPRRTIDEEGEEVEQIAEIPTNRWRSVSAPLGVYAKPCLIPKTGQGFSGTCQRSGVLPDSISLRHCLEKKLESEGIGGVSLECADVLNKGLDVFMKRLLERCPNIGGSQSSPIYTSMHDFRVAVETDRSVLGEKWPAIFEKISQQSFQ